VISRAPRDRVTHSPSAGSAFINNGGVLA
jgi:hypothetical protein